ncbi:hypothetical protein BVRB_4g074790 [Beta vulgaris subsp. vulgaris]|nr:hypothetical protein BVRB_4g074790 [Beta vulgaris subsp. vulgaris]
MNWLGFSLSPQELPSQTPDHGSNQDHHHHHFTSNNNGECFDLGPGSTPHSSLNHIPSSFGILEAFHRSTNDQSQDWNNMKGNSELSMLMGNQEVEEEPKLENFLGSSHSFRENHHQNNGDLYMFNTTHDNNNNSTMSNPKDITSPASNNNNNNNNGLNVSMIKTWLRSNHPPQSNIVDGGGGSGGGGANAQTLSLSMGTGVSQSALPLLAAGGGGGGGGGEIESSLSENSSSNNKQQLSDTTAGICNNTASTITAIVDVQSSALESVPRKSIDTFGQRTSIYRGVTRHRWTGRYEAHLWDNSCRREGQTRKGRQVYLGGYDKEEKAARAYDLAALKYWGTTTTTNFPITDYEKEVEDMKHMTRQEYVASLRRKSSGFSRGASIYRGVTRHHQHGRWQARIGRVAGNKDLYLGTFSTQEEAAEAYDIAAIKFRGLNAVTNFEINRYDVKAILDSTTLPIGGAAKRLKDVEDLTTITPDKQIIRAITSSNDNNHENSQLTNFGNGTPNFHSWPGIAFPQAQPLAMHYPYATSQQQQQQQQRFWCKQEVQDTTNDYQDHLNQQLQMNNGTHNFFQMHNLMGLENSSTSLEHSSGSNSVVYGNGNGNGNGNDHGVGNGYGLPFGMSTVIAHDGNGNGSGNGNEQSGYENYYYLSHQGNNNNHGNAAGVRGAVGTYDQGSACNNWVPTAIPTLVPRPNNMAAVGGHGGGGIPTFTVWNDT